MTITLVDYQGNTMGTLDLPDSTSQDVINEHLAMAAAPPITIPVKTIIESAVDQAEDFGRSLVTQFAAENVLRGITIAQLTQVVADYCTNLAYYLKSGSLYAAMNELNRMIADTSSAKTNVAPYITNDILYTYLNYVQGYLQIQLTANPGSGS